MAIVKTSACPPNRHLVSVGVLPNPVFDDHDPYLDLRSAEGHIGRNDECKLINYITPITGIFFILGKSHTLTLTGTLGKLSEHSKAIIVLSKVLNNCMNNTNKSMSLKF